MNSLRIESELVPPGRTAQVVKPIPSRHFPVAVMMTPETDSAFTIERVEILKPADVMAMGGPPQIGCLLRVRNDSSLPARFVAALDLSPDLRMVVSELGAIVERDWAQAYDRAIAALRRGSN